VHVALPFAPGAFVTAGTSNEGSNDAVKLVAGSVVSSLHPTSAIAIAATTMLRISPPSFGRRFNWQKIPNVDVFVSVLSDDASLHQHHGTTLRDLGYNCSGELSTTQNDAQKTSAES
jgi:hypothetical protein